MPDYSAQKEKQDLGYLTFDLQADLTPLFNWNAKQLFVFLAAEYETVDNKLNQVSWCERLTCEFVTNFVASASGCTLGQDHQAW